MSSTNFRSILIFASCVVGTRNILYGVSFYWEESFFLFTIMVSVGIYTLGGEFCYLFRSTLTIKKIMSKARKRSKIQNMKSARIRLRVAHCTSFVRYIHLAALLK